MVAIAFRSTVAGMGYLLSVGAPEWQEGIHPHCRSSRACAHRLNNPYGSESYVLTQAGPGTFSRWLYYNATHKTLTSNPYAIKLQRVRQPPDYPTEMEKGMKIMCVGDYYSQALVGGNAHFCFIRFCPASNGYTSPARQLKAPLMEPL